MSAGAKLARELSAKPTKARSIPDRINVIEFMENEDLLNYKPTLGARCALKVIYGMKLDSIERDFLAQEYAGHSLAQEPPGGWPKDGYSEALLVWGRGSTKSTVIAATAVYEGSTRDWHACGYTRQGELAYIMCVATRMQQADELAKQFIINFLQESKKLRHILVGKVQGGRPKDGKALEFGSTMRRIILSTGNAIVSIPCNSRAGRGYPLPVLILDEFMHWNRETSTQSQDKDVLRALEPRMAQFGEHKKLFAISTPCGETGLGWEWFDKRAESSDFRFTMHAPTWLMNPAFDPKEYEKAQRKDPFLFLQEFGALFIDPSLSFIDLAAIDAAFENAPVETDPATLRTAPIMAIDPAFKTDTFAMGIAHADPVQRMLYIDHLDGVGTRRQSGWTRNLKQQALKSDDLPESRYRESKANNAKAGIVPEAAFERVEFLYRHWNAREVWTDQFSSTLVVAELKKRGLTVKDYRRGFEERRNMYALLKTAIEGGRLKIAGKGTKWAERARTELRQLRVTQTPTGAVTITKGIGSSDDFTDVLGELVMRLWHKNRMGYVSLPGQMSGFLAQNKSARSDEPQATPRRHGMSVTGGSSGWTPSVDPFGPMNFGPLPY